MDQTERGGDAEPWLGALEAGLHDVWQLGRNIVLSWCSADDGIELLVVPHYLTATFSATHPRFSAEHARIMGDDALVGTVSADFLRDLITGGRRLEPGRLRVIAELLDVESVKVDLGMAIGDDRHDATIDHMVERYSISYVANRAVILFDIVGFARLGPFEQTSQLNSLSYSLNAAHARLMRNNIDVNFARSTTGDGFYIWNRDAGSQANVNLYHFMHIVLADNAIARGKSQAKVTPLLRAGFHIGDHYEFYQAEGLNPTVYNYIVGSVTIELARITEQALPGQVLLGDFTVPLAGVGDVDSEQFIAHLQDGLSKLRGMSLSGEEITDIKCYLTGDSHDDGSFAVRRYRLTDKHGFTRDVYNTKINIYRRHGEPILLGIQDHDLWRLRWRLRRSVSRIGSA